MERRSPWAVRPRPADPLPRLRARAVVAVLKRVPACWIDKDWIMRSPSLLLILGSLACGIVPDLGGAAPAGSPSLRDDARLRKLVTLQHRFITLEEGLAAVGKATGAACRAAPGLAGENVCLLVRERPAVE